MAARILAIVITTASLTCTLSAAPYRCGSGGAVQRLGRPHQDSRSAVPQTQTQTQSSAQ